MFTWLNMLLVNSEIGTQPTSGEPVTVASQSELDESLSDLSSTQTRIRHDELDFLPELNSRCV